MAVAECGRLATASLLLADTNCRQIADLAKGTCVPALAVKHDRDPLEWISEGLQQRRTSGQPVQTLHLIAHGRPGAFRIGDQWIDAEALKAHANELAHWGVETIALWSCHVGADADVVALLAELTGARVLASADWLGRDGEGNEQLQLGEWKLGDLLEPKTWPNSFRLAVSIEAADGSGICAEDELLFKVSGKNDAYVRAFLDLVDLNGKPLDLSNSKVWFKGSEEDWKQYNSGDIERLSASGAAYIKVKLPAKGSHSNSSSARLAVA